MHRNAVFSTPIISITKRLLLLLIVGMSYFVNLLNCTQHLYLILSEYKISNNSRKLNIFGTNAEKKNTFVIEKLNYLWH